MSTIRFTHVFNRKNKLNKFGEGLIQIRAYQSKNSKGRNLRYFTTGVYVKPEYWDERKHRIRNHPNEFQLSFKINAELQDLQLKYSKIFARFGKCSLDDLSRNIDNAFLSFDEFISKEIEISTYRKATITSYKNTQQKLKEFRARIYFDDLNFVFIESFNRFLKNKGLKLTTVAKHHKNLKFFINQAIRKDLFKSSDNPYLKFKVEVGRPAKRCVLSIYELEVLKNIEFDPSEFYLERIRDMFLFGCYTGLRFSDLSKLKLTDFLETSKGVVLNIVAVKTNKKLELPLKLLYPNADEISDPEGIYYKYKSLLGKLNKSKFPIFDGLSNQHCNRELKEIIKRGKLKKRITMHVARNSFGTNMIGKIPLPILKEIMQHSKIETTMIYVDLSNSRIEESLKSISWKK